MPAENRESEAPVLQPGSRHFLPTAPVEDTAEGETMADYLKDFIGCIDSRDVVPEGANMSEYTGRKFGEILRKKHQEGKL